MTEFTNYHNDIFVRRYQNDMNAAQRGGYNSPIGKMKNYCGDSKVPKYDQEPVLFKPMIKDIVHGATIDRVFSKTVTFKNHELRCSDGVILPRSFLELMEPKQRAQALALFEKGYLIVQICSATTFFSKRNKQLREAKSKLIQSDVCR